MTLLSVKKIVSVLYILLMLCLCAGCKNESYEPAEFTSAVLEVLPQATEETSLSLEGAQIESYFGFNIELLSDFSVVISSLEESAFELGALTLENADDLNTVIDGINRRHSDIVQTLSYINNSSGTSAAGFLLMQSDNTIIYVLSPDVTAAEEVLSEMGATEIK